jgi:hypothetical protein
MIVYIGWLGDALGYNQVVGGADVSNRGIEENCILLEIGF